MCIPRGSLRSLHRRGMAGTTLQVLCIVLYQPTPSQTWPHLSMHSCLQYLLITSITDPSGSVYGTFSASALSFDNKGREWNKVQRKRKYSCFTSLCGCSEMWQISCRKIQREIEEEGREGGREGGRVSMNQTPKSLTRTCFIFLTTSNSAEVLKM